jgi:cell division protein FtsQ
MARIPRPPARLLAGAALAVVGIGLGWLWFRDSSFARVERVVVTGSSSSEQTEVREALERAGAGMSTLHLDADGLRAIVQPYASVAGLRIRPDFPHTLRIEVLEHAPVALVQAGASSVAATGSGRLLNGVRADDVPTVKALGPVTDGRVTDRRTLGALAVAAAAPAQLRARTDRVTYGARGMTLDLSDGPALVFGSAQDAAAKWRAAARVLADGSSAGATYLDLRVPNLVAAGGVGPITPEATATPSALQANPQP